MSIGTVVFILVFALGAYCAMGLFKFISKSDKVATEETIRAQSSDSIIDSYLEAIDAKGNFDQQRDKVKEIIAEMRLNQEARKSRKDGIKGFNVTHLSDHIQRESVKRTY